MRWRAVCQVGSQARSSRFIVAFEEKNVERRTLVGVDHEGAGTTMKPVSSPRSSLSLSLSPHLLQNTRGHREASPSKYAHVSNVHFNHRSHRPSRAIAPSPLSFFLFFFFFFFFFRLWSLFFSGENLSSAERFHSVQHTPPTVTNLQPGNGLYVRSCPSSCFSTPLCAFIPFSDATIRVVFPTPSSLGTPRGLDYNRGDIILNSTDLSLSF